MLEELRMDRLPNREPIWIAVDALLASGLCIIALDQVRSDQFVDAYGAIGGAGLLLVLGPSALVLVRRSAPAAVLALATVLSVTAGFRYGESDALNAGPFIAYMVAATRPPVGAAYIVGAATVAISTLGFYGPGPVDLSVPLAAVVLYGVAWAAGARLRANRDRAAQLADDIARTREEADEVAHRAVVDERARIARELHDAVGHAVNVMVMQAGAARLVTSEPDAVAAFRNIERVGRLALTDLDRMLGLLHADGDGPAPRTPTYGLGDVAALVEGVRASGASIELHDRCGDQLDPIADRPVGAAAYRIVQEAVTNAVKHAGSAHIGVTLSCDDQHLTITVTDDGRGAAATNPRSSGGRGLAGMHERVAVLGGTFRSGPRPGGGYTVTARLPRDRQP